MWGERKNGGGKGKGQEKERRSYRTTSYDDDVVEGKERGQSKSEKHMFYSSVAAAASPQIRGGRLESEVEDLFSSPYKNGNFGVSAKKKKGKGRYYSVVG